MLKKILATHALLFAAAGMIGLGVSHSEDAGAATEMSSAASCFTDQDYNTDYLYRDGIANNSNGMGWRPRKVYCAITDTPERPRSSLAGLRVTGFDGNVQAGTIHDFQVKVCLTRVSSTTTTHYAYCSGTQYLNLGTYTNQSFDYALPSSIVNVAKQMSTYMANLVVQIPAHNGTPSIFYGHKLVY